MYALASRLSSLPVISLQTGETVATITELIIDSDRLTLMGFKLDAGRNPRTLLVIKSVRQLALDCVIIDTDDELSEPDDVIRLQEHIKSGYTPMNKSVVTDLGRGLGIVEDYTLNLETEQLQKLYVRPPLMKSWFTSSLIIDRGQIIDVKPTSFIVRDTHQYVAKMSSEATSAKSS